MTDQAPENATTRIDNAIARITAAARSGGPSNDGLQRRHDRLRAEVTKVLVTLDSLIDEEADEGGG